MNLDRYQDPDTIRDALQERCIAVVGLSPNPDRDSHDVAAYLQRQGYRIIPVNPRETTILGETCYPSLTAIPESAGPIGIVDVFRDPSAVPDIAREAVAAGAKYLWLQLGVISEPGIEIAEQAGLGLIVDRCIMVEHSRLAGRPH